MFVYHIYESLIDPHLYKTGLNICHLLYEDIGSVEFVTRDFMLMLFICSEIAGRSFIMYMRV